jgi:hypothetical protein
LTPEIASMTSVAPNTSTAVGTIPSPVSSSGRIELAARTAEGRTWTEVCELAARSLATNPYDLPFAMIYLVEAESQNVVLAGTAGIARGHRECRGDLDEGSRKLEVSRRALRRRVTELGLKVDE